VGCGRCSWGGGMTPDTIPTLLLCDPVINRRLREVLDDD
jgi:hypothetical protein